MRRRALLLFLFVALAANTKVSALSLVGLVTPIYDIGSTTTGTAIYSFNVGGSPSEGLSTFFMDFRGSAFSSVSSFSSLSGVGGWNGSLIGPVAAYGGFINAGESFSFSVRFVLQGLGFDDPLFNTPDYWGPTNSAWEQNFFAIAPYSFPPGVGGSTAMTPEPTTLALLGLGLFGAGLGRRYRGRGRNRK